MAKALGHNLRVNPLLQHKRGVGMAQTVKASVKTWLFLSGPLPNPL